MGIVGLILMVAGLIVALVGGIGVLIVAFPESILRGLGSIFVPFVSLIFVIMHWDKAGKPFLIHLAEVVPMILGSLMLGPEA